jgi:hypothetical protein
MSITMNAVYIMFSYFLPLIFMVIENAKVQVTASDHSRSGR